MTLAFKHFFAKIKFRFAFICKYTSTYIRQHCSEISCACKTWKSQNWEELGTVSKMKSSSPTHNALRVKQSRPYSPTLWVGKLRPEGGSDSSKISCLLEVTQQEFGVLLSFPGAWTYTQSTSKDGCPLQAVPASKCQRNFKATEDLWILQTASLWRTQKPQHHGVKTIGLCAWALTAIHTCIHTRVHVNTCASVCAHTRIHGMPVCMHTHKIYNTHKHVPNMHIYTHMHNTYVHTIHTCPCTHTCTMYKHTNAHA